MVSASLCASPSFVPEQVADEQKAADGYGERGDQKE